MDVELIKKQVIWNGINFDVVLDTHNDDLQPSIILIASRNKQNQGFELGLHDATYQPTKHVPHIKIGKNRSVLSGTKESAEIGSLLQAKGLIEFTGHTIQLDGCALPVIKVLDIPKFER